MGEFDESVRVALRERAEGTVRLEELLTGARRRGVRRRRLRHALLGVTATAVVAAALTSVSLFALPAEGELEAAEIRGVSALPRPPAAGRHGTNLLRLDVADPAARWLQWTTDSDERQALRVGRARAWDASYTDEYLVVRGGSEADLDQLQAGGLEKASVEQVAVGGVTGTLRLSVGQASSRWASLRWKRPDGIWLGVYITFTTVANAGQGNDRAAILQAARWVRVNVGYRCVADFRLAWTPPGARPVGCRMRISAADRSYGLVFADGKQGRFLAYTDVMAPPDALRSIDTWQASFMVNTAEQRYGDGRLFVVGGPLLSQEDVFRIVFGFVAQDDPIPEK